MNYCRDYYNANEVAQESYDELYAWKEQPTLCDCGREAEHGQVYCKDCLDRIDFTMRNAIKLLRYNAGVSEDEAEQMAVCWLENTEEFKERRNGNIKSNTV